jgi:hypothetical protein
MWQQLKDHHYYYNCCHRHHDRHHDCVHGRQLYAGHLGDIVHERFLRDELAEAAGLAGEG